jgi:Trypsin-like peptidase domain
MPIIDEYSLAAIPIQMLFNATELSVGTAFIWKLNDSHWLITNWHNVSGRDPNTGKHLSRTAAEPNKLRVLFNVRGQLGPKVVKKLEIRNASNAPLWLVHPTHKNQIDVVAVAIQNYADVDMYAINTLSQLDLAVRIGVDVFVLGFPFGLGPAGFPVWKRGSIASEPKLPSAIQRHLFVDTASRPGMSGAPVIRRSWTTHSLANGGTLENGASATKFVGVYSGRLASTDPLDAQLGVAWPASLVDEIVSGGVVDS